MSTQGISQMLTATGGMAMPNREVVYGIYNVYYRIDGRLIPTRDYPPLKKY